MKKLKVLLVNPARFSQDTYTFPPIHLMYVAQAIQRSGHEAEIVDVPYLLDTQEEKYTLKGDAIIDFILSHDYDVLGIGSVVSSYAFAERLVIAARQKSPNIPILVGGSLGVPIKEVWGKNHPVDYLWESDCEHLIGDFLDKCACDDVRGMRLVPGIYWWDPKNKDYVGNEPKLPMALDHIPFLEHEAVDIEYFSARQRDWIKQVLRDRYDFSPSARFFPIIMSRGCAYDCTFCFHFNRLYRKHSPKYIADNIEFLKSRYNAEALYIFDDLTIFDNKWLEAVCDEIIRRDLNIKLFSSGGKPSVVKKEILEKMYKAGFRRISYGVESGSQRILNIMNKGTTVADNYNAIQLTREVGIPFSVNIVFGMPGESVETMNETRDFLISLDIPRKAYYASLAVPYPGTKLFDFCLEQGVVHDVRDYLLNIGGYSDYRYNLTKMNTRQLINKKLAIEFSVERAYLLRRNKIWQAVVVTLEQTGLLVYSYVPLRLRRVLRISKRIRDFLQLCANKER